MDVLLKVIALSFVASSVVLAIKADRPELSFIIMIAAGVIGFSLLLTQVREVVVFASDIAAKSGISGGVYTALLKMIGIGYLTEIAAETVADFGSQSLSSKITLAGKLCIFILGIPIFKTLLGVVSELL